MKEELTERLMMSLDKVQEYIESTEDFVIEQAPLVAQEIITLGRVESAWQVVCPAIISVVALALSVICIRRALAIFRGEVKSGTKEQKPGEPTMVTGVISGAVSIVVFLIAIFHIVDVFEPWVAPRVYLINQIKDML